MRTIRTLCHCGQPVRSKGRTTTGLQVYDRVCWKHREDGYRVHKKAYCESCAFIAIHPCQLDVDHIDGNHFNNDESNLMTLCANCHRLKTQTNNDHQPHRSEKPYIVDDQLDLFEVFNA